MKLAVLVGDLRGLPPAVAGGECKLRRLAEPSLADLAAALWRMASCILMEGATEPGGDLKGGDFFGEVGVFVWVFGAVLTA